MMSMSQLMVHVQDRLSRTSGRRSHAAQSGDIDPLIEYLSTTGVMRLPPTKAPFLYLMRCEPLVVPPSAKTTMGA